MSEHCKKAAERYTEIFIRYYQRGFWANASGSSGPNSAFEYTALLRENLTKLFAQLRIQSVLDAGCGDANLMRYMDLSNINYVGIDCVPEMIEKNRAVFSNHANMRFDVNDVVNDILPQADLILCRDVVHYLPNEMIKLLLQNFRSSGSRYLLITHNLYAPLSANTPTEVGVFRPVNLCQEPFNWPAPLHTIAEDVYAKELALWDLQSII